MFIVDYTVVMEDWEVRVIVGIRGWIMGGAKGSNSMLGGGGRVVLPIFDNFIEV